MDDGIHVVAVGARTPLGLTAEATMTAVRADICAIADHPFMIDRAAEPLRVARDSRLDPGLTGPERLVAMATAALGEIAPALATISAGARRLPLLLCLPEIRPGWDPADSHAVAEAVRRNRAAIEFQPVDVASVGHAAGLTAVHVACERIRSGREDFCAIVGVDSYLRAATLEWLDRNRQLATSYHRGAFFPGEGGAAVVLASTRGAQRCGLQSLGTIAGTSTAVETRLIKTDSVCLGDGLTECVRQAATAFRASGRRVDGIICDINGERYRAEEWGFAMLRLPDTFVDATAYAAPASCWGDMGAASGPLFLTMAVVAGRRGWSRGARYLIWSSSEGGLRAAAAVELPTEREGHLQ